MYTWNWLTLSSLSLQVNSTHTHTQTARKTINLPTPEFWLQFPQVASCTKSTCGKNNPWWPNLLRLVENGPVQHSKLLPEICYGTALNERAPQKQQHVLPRHSGKPPCLKAILDHLFHPTLKFKNTSPPPFFFPQEKNTGIQLQMCALT